MFMDCIGQKFEQGTLGTTCLCFMMSGVSAGKTQRLGVNEWWGLEPSKDLFTHMSGPWAGTNKILVLPRTGNKGYKQVRNKKGSRYRNAKVSTQRSKRNSAESKTRCSVLCVLPPTCSVSVSPRKTAINKLKTGQSQFLPRPEPPKVTFPPLNAKISVQGGATG